MPCYALFSPKSPKKEILLAVKQGPNPQVLVPTYITSCIWWKGLSVGDAWKHIFSLGFQTSLNWNVKLKWVLLSASYVILLLPALDFERHVVAKAHHFYFKLSQNEVAPRSSWTLSCSFAHLHESPTARQQHWHSLCSLHQARRNNPFFWSLEVSEVPYHPHVFAVLFFETSSSTAHQNWHSIADKKWAVTIKVTGPTSL